MYQKLREKNSVAFAIYRLVRNNIGLREYPIYVFALFLLKYISDVYLDVISTEKTNVKKKTNVRQKGSKLSFSVPTVEFAFSDSPSKLPANFYTLYEHRHATNLDEIFNFVFQTIEEQNPKIFEGFFKNIDFTSEELFGDILGKREERNLFLKDLLETFYKDELDMRPSTVPAVDIRRNFTDLVQHFASVRSYAKAHGNEFSTPVELGRLLVELVQPKGGDTICDPACGVGGFLLQAKEFAEKKNNMDVGLFGQEVNRYVWVLCRMNMFLHNIDNARIEWGDTLNNPLLVEKNKLKKFDIVLTNPPLMIRSWRKANLQEDVYNRFGRDLDFSRSSSWAFISHTLETAMEKTGRVAVLVPHGVLFRHGAEKYIR